MSYDIPDEIKYREKIVFGLDIRQLCCACAFALLAFLSYGLPLQGQAKLILPAFFGILGAGFIIFKLEEKVLDALHYFRGVRKANAFSPEAHNLVGIRAIENNQITLRDGSLRAILRVEPINFSLLDEGQKSAFVSNYREFLNHLSSPIQILAKSLRSDAEDTFSRMQENMEGADKEIAALFRDFIDFEGEYIEKQVVMGRDYCLIVTQSAPRMLGKGGESRAQLEQKVKIIQEKLAACGLRSERLDTKGLLRFFSTYSMHDFDEEGQEKEEEKLETEKEVKQCCSTRERKGKKKQKQKHKKKSRRENKK